MKEETHLFRWYGSLIYENLANVFTALRMWIVAYLAGLFFVVGANPWSDPRFFWLAIAAALTDFIDGLISRWTGNTSVFGSNFDKTADKFGELCFFAMIITMAFTVGQPWLVLFFLPIFRTELFLVGAWLYGYRNGKDSSAGPWGKRKMALFFALFCLWLMPQNYWAFLKYALGADFSGYFYVCFAALLFIGSILAEMSFIGYLRKYAETATSKA